MSNHTVLPESLGLHRILEAGGTVTVGRHPRRGQYIDLNTEMKSHLHLYWDEENQQWLAHTRYDTFPTVVESWEDVLGVVKKCLYGRVYMNSAWRKILVDDGYIQAKTKTIEELYCNGRQLET